jgi:hypothetical protein
VITRSELSDAAQWAAQILRPHGRIAAAPARRLPWSTLIPLIAGKSRFWLKIATRTDCEYHVLTSCAGPPRSPVPTVEAYEGNRGWLLTHHSDGTPIDASGSGQLVRTVLGVVRARAELTDRRRSLPTVTLPLLLAHIEHSLRGLWWDRRTAFALADALARNRHRFEELDVILQRREAVVIHGDLHPGNVLRCAQSLIILDWTDCGIGSPLWDEAMLHTNFAGYPHPPTLGSNSCRILSGVKALADLVTTEPPAPTETYSVNPQRVYNHAHRIAYGLIDTLDAYPDGDAHNVRALSSTSKGPWSCAPLLLGSLRVPHRRRRGS